MSAEVGPDAVGLDRRLNRLAAERSALFAKAGTDTGLATSERQRLTDIERELDSCFALRREQRAARDARRFRA